MSNKNSSLVNISDEVDKCQSSVFENQALQSAFRRIQNDNHFSEGIPEITDYDDYKYPDCDYDDNGNN